MVSLDRLSADAKWEGQDYRFLRPNGVWTQVVTSFDPDVEAGRPDPYYPVRNISPDYPP